MATAETGQVSSRKVTIAIIAGEASGDILGAGLIRSLRKRYPKARFVGIGGDEMIAEGFHSLVPLERLSVMGLVEVLGRIRELFSIRARLLEYFFTTPPDVVIGIDSPDFTLAIERRCREAGIPSVHYVSPSVWAWRQKRIFKIAKSVDLMLTLFPFEARFYEEHNVPVAFVGHPLADRIPMQPDTGAARKALGLNLDRRGAAGQALFQMNTNRPVDGTLIQDRYAQSQSQFYGALPSYLDVEMAVVEPRVLKQLRSLPPDLKVRVNFLGRQIGRVTLFRQRIPIRDMK